MIHRRRFRVFKSVLEIRGRDWQDRISNMLDAAVILHNVFLDLGEVELPIVLPERLRSVDPDEEAGHEANSSRELRDRLAMFVDAHWRLNEKNIAVRK